MTITKEKKRMEIREAEGGYVVFKSGEEVTEGDDGFQNRRYFATEHIIIDIRDVAVQVRDFFEQKPV